MIYLWFILVLLRNCGKLRKYIKFLYVFFYYFTWDLFKNSSCHFCFARFFPFLLFEECSFLDFELAKILHIAEKEGKTPKKKITFQLLERKLNINLKHTFSFHYCCFWSSDCLFHNFQFLYVSTQTDIDTDRDCNQKELWTTKKIMKEIQ